VLNGDFGFNKPSGYKYGTPPAARGEHGWEKLFHTGMLTGITILVIGEIYRPNENVKDWAYAEAKNRLKESGTMPSYEPIHKEPGAQPPKDSYPTGIDHS